MARVIISSGHTTSSPGTIVGDLREVDLARKIAKMVTPYLRQNGIITLAVPYEMELPKRIDWINSTGYKAQQNDVVLEIHINEGGKSGVEAWYVSTENGASKQFATAITNSIKARTGLKIQGINDEKTHEYGGIGLLQQVGPISALIECLYIDNPEDQKFLRSEPKLDDLAEAIAAGIADFLGVEFTGRTHTKTASVPAPVQKSVGQKPVEQRPVAQQKQVEPKPVEPKPVESKGVAEKSTTRVVTQAKSFSSRDGDDYDEQEDEEDEDYEDDLDTDDESRSDQNEDGMNDANSDHPQPNPIAKPAFSAPGPQPTFGSKSLPNQRDNFPAFGGGSAAGSSAFGGGNQSGGSFGGSPAVGSTFGGTNASGGKAPMSREERKDMISKYYKKAFGKEPSQGDLNYFLNIGISEDQFIKRIMDSQDHQDQVQNAIKFKQINNEFEQLKAKYESLEKAHSDQRLILEKLNSLLLQKNQALANLQRRSQLLMNKIEEIQGKQGPPKIKIDYKESTFEKFLKYLSKKLS
jgi:N-acetylmuramoyl-L-alanine amidase